MKKQLKPILIIAGALFVLYHILSWSRVFTMYNNPTLANEPNLKLGSFMFATNLIAAKNGDFVCYQYQDEVLGKHIRVHRLCAMENDTIEIKNGILFINGKNVDQGLDLVHYYELTSDELSKIKDSKNVKENPNILSIDKNKTLLPLEDSFAKSNGLTTKRLIEQKGKTDNSIRETFDQNWNKDHFGPLIVPKDKIFVLGDNRDNSEDSRRIGFINKSDIVGVILK